MNRRLSTISFALASLTLVTARGGIFDEEDEGWTRNFRLGALMSYGIDARFSLHGSFGLSGSNPGGSGLSPGDHIYDDGYVRTDDTGDAQGLTSYWGYQNSSQYDPATHKLTFHNSQSYAIDDQSTQSDTLYAGLDLAYGGKIMDWGSTRIGWELGFGWLPIVIRDQRPLSASFVRQVQQFDTGPIVLPSAPYNGGSSGIGPVISDIPTSLPDVVSTGTITGDRRLEVTLYNIRLGPTAYWSISEHWAWSAGGGFSLGVLDGQYRFNETVQFSDGSSAISSGRAGDTDLLYGGYVNAMLYFHTEQNADVYLGVQYSPLGNSTFGVGGRSAELRLDGAIYFLAGFHWPF
ncbi:MAG TPA: hypothetical protein VMB21_05715 [Candidatus Limnocylindria bacterium]|nr:hypothetical protein [Candidatus Limnocylindria bacterium]